VLWILLFTKISDQCLSFNLFRRKCGLSEGLVMSAGTVVAALVALAFGAPTSFQ